MRVVRALASVLPVLLVEVACSDAPAPAPEVRVSGAGLNQVGDVFRYFGRWSRRPAQLERSVFVGEHEFFTSEEGLLRAQREGDRKVKEFNPFHAAAAQGHMPPTVEGLSKGARGFYGGGGRIWFGTDGVGILSYDPIEDLWARYDLKPESVPGWPSNVLHADEQFVFAEIHPHGERAGSGLCVFSIEQGIWFQLERVSRPLLKSAGHSGEIDHRPYQSQERLPVTAVEVTLEADVAYRLRTPFSNGTETLIEIPVELLAEAL